CIAEYMPASNEPDLDLACEFLKRCRVKKHGIERNVEAGHDQKGGDNRTGQVPVRVLDLACNIGRCVPPGISVKLEDKAERERSAGDVAGVWNGGCKRDILRRPEGKAGNDQSGNEPKLYESRYVLKHAAAVNAAKMHERYKQRHAKAEYLCGS